RRRSDLEGRPALPQHLQLVLPDAGRPCHQRHCISRYERGGRSLCARVADIDCHPRPSDSVSTMARGEGDPGAANELALSAKADMNRRERRTIEHAAPPGSPSPRIVRDAHDARPGMTIEFEFEADAQTKEHH